MARKTLLDIDPKVQSVLEEFNLMSSIRVELAKDAYDVQDEETQAVIDRVVATLRTYATGTITAKVGRTLVPVKIENDVLGWNLLYLAVEIVKDLAFMDYRVATFKFPEQMCSSCGVTLSAQNVHRSGKRKKA
jgi:hypothetical protein